MAQAAIDRELPAAGTSRRRRGPAAAALALAAVAALALAACDVPVTPAGKLYDAWVANDTTAAHAVATNAAVSAMFSQPYAASTGWFFSHCEGAAGSTYCTWINKKEGRLQMRVDNASNTVVAVDRFSLGSDPAGYFFHAWRVGDSSGALTFGSTAARDALFAITYAQSVHWMPEGCDGTAGALYCTWHDDGARKLTLKVDMVSVPHKVVEVTLSAP